MSKRHYNDENEQSSRQMNNIQMTQITKQNSKFKKENSKLFYKRQNQFIQLNFTNSNHQQISKQVSGNDEKRQHSKSKYRENCAVLSSVKFQFKILCYLCEVAISYVITISLMFLIKHTNFPFFSFLFVLGLMVSVSPWSLTNTMLLVCCGVIIGNHILSITILTYPIILICYLSVLIFNQHNKLKIIYIPVLIVVIIWGFIVIPSLCRHFNHDFNNNKGFYYIFPLFVFIVRMFLYASFRVVKFSEYIFLQLPFFLLGLEYGVMMTVSASSIQFWYLIVFFTLQIVNDRTQFMLNLMVSMWQSCDRIRFSKKKKNAHKEKTPGNQPLIMVESDATKVEKSSIKIIERDISILPAHASGYSCINSFHIVCIVYVFTKLPFYTQPYSTNTTFYIPLIIWIFGFAYEAMCLILQRKRKDKLLIGFTNNGILHTILRGCILAVGLWMFYLGLGIGNYAVYNI